MNETEKNRYSSELDVLDILRTLWANKLILLAFMAVAAVIAYVKVVYFTADTYTANGVLFVSNKSVETMEAGGVIQQADLMTSRTLGETCVEILQTRSFLKMVSEDLDHQYTWNQIRSMARVSPKNETELLSITVTASSPETAYLVASSIIKQAPVKLSGVFKRGDFEIVDEVEYPDRPNGRGLVRTMILSLVIGAILGSALVLVRMMFDTKIHRADDLKKRYDITVLGEIA